MSMQSNLDELGALIESYKREGMSENEVMEQLAMNLMRQALMPRLVRGLMDQAERERGVLLETVSSKLLPPPIQQPQQLRPTPIYSNEAMDEAIDGVEEFPRVLRRNDEFVERVTDAVNGMYRRTA